MESIELAARARYGYGGKQFVARITGRHPKFTFEREFLGKKTGKRGEDTDVVRVDEPGLYQERDIDSKGRDDNTYWVVERDVGGLRKTTVTEEQAMALAKDLTGLRKVAITEWISKARSNIKMHEEKIALGDLMVIVDNKSVARVERIEVFQGEIVRLTALLAPEPTTPPEPAPDNGVSNLIQAAAFVRNSHSVQGDSIVISKEALHELIDALDALGCGQ